MDSVVVRHGSALEGSVAIGGAKNSALKLMAATLLAEGRYVLHNVPRIADVETMSDLLRAMGVEVRREADHTLAVERPFRFPPGGVGGARGGGGGPPPHARVPEPHRNRQPLDGGHAGQGHDDH